MSNIVEEEKDLTETDAPVAQDENLDIAEQTLADDAQAKKQTVQMAKKPRKGANKIKGTASELKKVTWPSFKTVVKNTAVVLSVTAIFLLVIIGIDQLLYLLYDLLTKNL